MTFSQQIKKSLRLDTYGWIAVASLLLCTLTGALLAIPFDISQPYISVATLVISNPAASFTRNLHYWSAQSFLVFTILHVFDHLYRYTEDRITRRGVWFRLMLSLVFAGYVMISGFILKADADSLQARHILSSLLDSVPLAGRLLQGTFIGPEGNWQLMYVQHVSVATIILFIAVYEHARTIWVKWRTLIVTSALLAALSWFFRAPLAPGHVQVMKGPWYFVGLQEALHWISRPWIVFFIVLVWLVVLYFVPKLPLKQRSRVKWVLGLSAGIYLLLTATGFFFRGKNWQWQWPWNSNGEVHTALYLRPLHTTIPGTFTLPVPVSNGTPEACLACHAGMQGLSEMHNEKIAGCYSCHGGDPFTLNKQQAHRGMYTVPGNLSNAAATCGSAGCHPGIVDRVEGSMMATLRGMIAVDRFTFGETSSPNGHAGVKDLGHDAADTHLRNLCAGCHLGSEKQAAGPSSWLERGGGCNACHLTYRENAAKEFASRQSNKTANSEPPNFHPSIDLEIGNDKCMSCHSRSGRIAMNYEGWHETGLVSVSPGDGEKYRTLPDGRIFRYITPDIHHEKGLACIDCHSSFELMGDGEAHLHKEDAVKVECADCHPEGKAATTISMRMADRETQMVAWLRKFRTGAANVVATRKGNVPLVNMFTGPDGSLSMQLKLNGKTLPVKPRDPACSAKAHERLSCDACHTSWAPQCLGCHNSYEKQAEGYDMLRKTSTKGSWVEFDGQSLAEAPVLGVNTSGKGHGKIQTFVPGMIMTIDKGSFDKESGTIFHRLYAPASAHTTRRNSRSCISCHNDPLALGYGRGTLTFSGNGKWIFDQRYENNRHDRLPEDAWTGFLGERKGISATRSGMRPFSIPEQKKILTVGACLTCHEPGSAVMRSGLDNFRKVLGRRSVKCVMPAW